MFQTISRRIIQTFHITENGLLLGLSISVGLSTGFCVWLFRQGIEFIEQLTRHDLPHYFPEWAQDWSIVVILGLAGLIIGSAMHYYVGEQRHHGVAGIIEATALAGGRLPYTKMPIKALASVTSIGAGASVGPEDPSVQIGANLGSFFGQSLQMSEDRTRLLVAAGAASAIAAAFNAPIAGVFFALEVILADFTSSSIGVVVLAAVMSSVFMQSTGHSEVELGIREYTLGGTLQIPFYIVLGLIAAPISARFIRLVYWQHDFWHHYIHLSRPLKTTLAGVLVGIAGVFFPQILGTGHETMNEVLNTGSGDFTIQLLLALVFIKLIFTTVSLSGGFVGGIFAPSLFVGAMLGGAYGRLVEQIAPSMNVGDPAAYAIAGMGAMMAGVVRAPITAILLIFELTNNYQMILPIMLTTVVCVYLSERFQPDGIYAYGLRRQGFYLQQGRDVDVMQSILVEEVMITPPPTIHPEASLSALRSAFRAFVCRTICVIDHQERLIGIVTMKDLQTAYEAAQQAKTTLALTVGDICNHDPVTIIPAEPVWTAIRRMGQFDFQTLPVVAADNPEKVIGVLRRADIMRGYSMAITRKFQSQYIQQKIRLSNLLNEQVLEMQIHETSEIAGKAIREVDWCQSTLVASIRRGTQAIVPHGDTRLEVGDRLTLITEPECTGYLLKLIEEPM